MFRSTCRSLKNLRFFYFIPVIINLLYMPFMSFLMYQSYYDNIDIYYRIMSNQFNLFLPIASVWWSVFTLKEFIESDGNEVLYLYCKPLYILKMQLLVFSIYGLHLVVFMLGFNLFFDGFYFVIVQLLVSSFALCSFVYFVSFALKSTGVALLLSIVYSMFLNVFDLDKKLVVISIFPQTTQITKSSLLNVFFVFVLGVIMYLLGLLISKNKLVYK